MINNKYVKIVTLITIMTSCSQLKTTAKSSPINENIKNSKDSINIMLTRISREYKNLEPSKSQFEKAYHDYEGNVGGKNRIQMSIYPLGKYVVGTYFYEKQGKEIRLKCRAGKNNIVLYEYNDKGKEKGIFQGVMKTVDKIEGIWIGLDNKKYLHFKLSLRSIIYSDYGKRYEAAVGSDVSDKYVENFVNKIKSYVAKGNKELLAEKVAYPINVTIKGKVYTIRNKTLAFS